MNWKWGTAFAIMVFVMLVSIVFAFVQQTLAKEAERHAVKAMELAQEQRKMAEVARAEADKQRLAAEETMALCQATLAELEKLKGKRK